MISKIEDLNEEGDFLICIKDFPEKELEQTVDEIIGLANLPVVTGVVT